MFSPDNRAKLNGSRRTGMHLQIQSRGEELQKSPRLRRLRPSGGHQRMQVRVGPRPFAQDGHDLALSDEGAHAQLLRQRQPLPGEYGAREKLGIRRHRSARRRTTSRRHAKPTPAVCLPVRCEISICALRFIIPFVRCREILRDTTTATPTAATANRPLLRQPRRRCGCSSTGLDRMLPNRFLMRLDSLPLFPSASSLVMIVA
jgi:hypothetical protein